MKRFAKIYLEITNQCNLHCSFCPKTKRAPRQISVEEFRFLLARLRPHTDYLYFHLMGEPLWHPQLMEFLKLAGEAGFRVVLTTNGTLLGRYPALPGAPALHKVNISLHAFEANTLSEPFSDYLARCIRFGKAAEHAIVCYRLWNAGGAEEKNGEILQALHEAFPAPWQEGRQGTRLQERVYLQFDRKFDWPDLAAPSYGPRGFCRGLRDQIGVLCDGTVVPCCLDHEGDLALGNLFSQELEPILHTARAQAIYDGFSARKAIEPLCRRCGYAQRFQKGNTD